MSVKLPAVFQFLSHIDFIQQVFEVLLKLFPSFRYNFTAILLLN